MKVGKAIKLETFTFSKAMQWAGLESLLGLMFDTPGLTSIGQLAGFGYI